MAEIKVEPKRGGLGWLWAIIILALIAAAAWYFMNNNSVPATSPADSVRTSMLDRSAMGKTAIGQAAIVATSGVHSSALARA
jgi:uncharacterized membrane protein